MAIPHHAVDRNMPDTSIKGLPHQHPALTKMPRSPLKLLRYTVTGKALLILAVSVDATMVPFILPWNDTSENVTNIAHWSHRPAGTFGYLQANSNGELYAGEKRMRLWGVNVTAGACFPSHEDASQIAARMAKFGINVVRFHHMNATWSGDYTLIDYSRGNSRSLRPSTLDKLDYLINELKQNGIYTNLNLLVSRKFYAADGLPAEIDQVGWKESHTIGHFNAHHLELQKEFATLLLNHVNPYTGLALKADPAIATVEILNENSLFKAWFSGDLDGWPSVFQQQVTPQWNDWLTDKYGTTGALKAAWGIISESPGADLLANGDLRSGNLSGWTLEQHQGATGTLSRIENAYLGNPALRVQVGQTGSEGWHLQAKYTPVSLQAGQIYTIRAVVRGSNNQPVGMNISLDYNPWSNIGVQKNLTLSGDWQVVELSFIPDNTDNNLRIIFNGFAKLTGWVDISSLTLRPGGTIGGLPEEASLEAGSIPWPRLSQNDAGASEEMMRDWFRFLLHKEKAYIAAMESHLRETIGYPGIILSTQTGYAPAEALYDLDAADSHAYWQHPTFPGSGWDPYNWYIENESMVNSPPGTLWSLAKRRIMGVPYFVSEYQHAFPNTYSTEAPLLIAAYAALQNWDGIYFFNYGSQHDDWNRGFFNQYFDMSVHPGNMANLLLGAALFRREDVLPAIHVHRYPSPSESFFDQMLDRPNGSWISSIDEVPFDGKHTLLSRLEVDPGILNEPNFNWPDPVPGTVFTSDTGELLWDTTSAAKAFLTVKTPRTKALVGFVDGRIFDFDGITLTPHANQQDWLTFGITAMEGDSILSDLGSRCLLIATGECGNSGMQWNLDKTSLVNNNWGTSPSLVEVIGADVSLPLPPSRVQVWALDPTGKRTYALPLGEIDRETVFTIGSPSQTMWYEIEISPVPVIRATIESETTSPSASTTVIFTVSPTVSQSELVVESSTDLSGWTSIPLDQLQWETGADSLSASITGDVEPGSRNFYRAYLEN